MSQPKTLRSLLVDELRNMYFSEQKLVKAIPKLAKASHDPHLKTALTTHLAETRGHVKRLTQAFKILGFHPQPTISAPLVALVHRGGEAAHSRGSVEVRDADIIGAAQGVEHFEMASYAHACALAEALDEFEVVKLLQQNFEEEDAASRLLSKISSDVNRSAMLPHAAPRVAAGR
jgi:ferritin-like metal-binding protein YciE